MQLMSHREVTEFINDFRRIINHQIDLFQKDLDNKFDREMTEMEEYYQQDRLSDL